MTQLDLNDVIQRLGPRFAWEADERDHSDAFAAEHVEALKREKIYSALVPVEIGGGGVTHSQMCAFLRAMATCCPSTALTCRCTSISSRRRSSTIATAGRG